MPSPPSALQDRHSPPPVKSAEEYATESFYERFGGQENAGGADSAPAAPVVIGRAPGRVNLLGDHTDYNDGFVLPATIDRAVYVALRRRDDQQVCLRSVNFKEEAAYALPALPLERLPMWARYAAGVTEELRRRGALASGFEGTVYGNVPLGAGLSSSAALEVAVAIALDRLFDLRLGLLETVKLCQHVEHEYVGTQCGIMDQFASRVGRSGHALFLDCRSLDYEHIPLPLCNAAMADDAAMADEAATAGDAEGETCLVITDSGVSRELADSKYNERRAECDEAVRHFRQFDDQVEALRDVTEPLLEAHGAGLSDALYRRARHVVTENKRVEEGSRMLDSGQLARFGALMNASHASLANDYEVSAPELDTLVTAAQTTDGVLGARMTGAGFGGCTVALARRSALSALRRRTDERYQERHGKRPKLYVVEHNLEAGVL